MAECLNPWKDPKTGLFLPCGKCYECKARRISGWSFRLMKEAERSDSAFFITLTYDLESVIITNNGFMTLSKTVYGKACKIKDRTEYNAQNSSDIQTFIKLLRYHEKGTDKSIKYYTCGEYGGKSGRPHYHAIVFNASLSNLVGERVATQIQLGNIRLDGKKPFTCRHWKYGHITIGTLTGASVGYTLKYISKPSRIPLHSRDDRVPEYSLMSKGLGDNYLTPSVIKWHKQDLENRMYVPIEDGKRIAMPRIFKEKIYTKWQREKISQHVEKQQLEQEKNKTLAESKKDDEIRRGKGAKAQKDARRNLTL